MNDKALGKKVNRDVDQAKKDFATLKDDSAAGLTKMKKDLTTLGDDGVASLNRKFDKLADDTKEMIADALETINKDVGQGLSQYNSKVQDAADRVPGNLGKKAARYPWVAITISLAIGLLLGFLLKPGRQSVEQL